MTSPSLRQLDIFAQMVASGSVVHCARDLGLSVNDVERDMASLEMRLGYRLFDHVGDKARLTPAGRKTAQAMTLLSQGEDHDGEHVEPAATPPPLEAPMVAPISPRRPITLAAPAPVFGHFQDALTAFEDANEDIAITLDLNIQLASDAGAGLSSGQVDIAYFYALEAPDYFDSRYGWSEQLNLYAGGDHPLAHADVVSRADISAAAMLAMDRQNGLRHVIDDALQSGGIMLGRPSVETDNMFEIIEALRAGRGCFAAFGPMARDLGRMSGVHRLSLDTQLPAIEVRQAVAKTAATNPGVQALADFLFL